MSTEAPPSENVRSVDARRGAGDLVGRRAGAAVGAVLVIGIFGEADQRKERQDRVLHASEHAARLPCRPRR